jgi:hypothetical protein
MKKGNVVALIVVVSVILMTLASVLILRQNRASNNPKEVVNLSKEDIELSKLEKEMDKDVPEIGVDLEGNTGTGSTAPSAVVEVDTELNNLDTELNNINLPDIEADL